MRLRANFVTASPGRETVCFVERSIAELDGAADAQLAHASLESGALDVEEDGGAFGAGDAPLCLLQGPEDVLTFGFLEGGDRRG